MYCLITFAHFSPQQAEGYAARFYEYFRMWELNFSYCEERFRKRVISDVQIVITKPEKRREPIPCIEAT